MTRRVLAGVGLVFGGVVFGGVELIGSRAFSASPAVTQDPGVAIGYCTGDLEAAKAAGFDYAEMGVRSFARLTEQEFARLVERHRAAGLPTPAGNLFLPGDMTVVGPDTDPERLVGYVRTAFARAERLGIRIVVFGSGDARRVPEGVSRDEAFRQLVAFARRIAPDAERHGIVVAVEPLRREETNIINTVAEALTWVEAVDHPSFQLMVDLFHLASERENPEILRKAARHLRHVHVANPRGRVFPLGPAEYDYAPFFETLRKAGYQGGISIEAKTANLSEDAPKAIAFLRAAYASGAGRPPRVGTTPPGG